MSSNVQSKVLLGCCDDRSILCNFRTILSPDVRDSAKNHSLYKTMKSSEGGYLIAFALKLATNLTL